VAFILDDALHRFGVLTDLGHVFKELLHAVGSLDAVLIESNYDVSMLRRGPYPEFLKTRISGSKGHLSNLDAAHLLKQAASPKLQWACLAHLSDENNDPQLAIETHHEILGVDFPLTCANRRKATDLLHISDSCDTLKRATASPVVTQQAFAWTDQ
jgi:phosphoribosyl 1,2-cyclic phosphodiesterase